jgi:hypothetical protein
MTSPIPWCRLAINRRPMPASTMVLREGPDNVH